MIPPQTHGAVASGRSPKQLGGKEHVLELHDGKTQTLGDDPRLKIPHTRKVQVARTRLMRMTALDSRPLRLSGREGPLQLQILLQEASEHARNPIERKSSCRRLGVLTYHSPQRSYG